ncbi:unnamed protein product [Rotaria sordida]|uniref:EF-hand domain-containing protein n=1 Tax=Rotaria sordida TaxID=392033 RepID=A0A813PJS9_9BILA|nr:unnamed protein product [Rotaria sordida]CAF0749876.1 unnamed protein product [Rotaria sordida]CAF0788303.1 unnamed protein product [Rotaria sordida]
MSSAREAASALPSNFDMNGLTNAFSNPIQAFRMLDKNNDGRVTKEDLQLLLQQFGINDANGNGTIEPSDLVHANGILSNLLKTKQGGGDY